MALIGNIGETANLNTTIERIVDVTPDSADVSISPRGRYLITSDDAAAVLVFRDAHGTSHTLELAAGVHVLPFSASAIVDSGTTVTKVCVGY